MMSDEKSDILDLATDFVELHISTERLGRQRDALNEMLRTETTKRISIQARLRDIAGTEGPFAIAVSQGIVVVDEYGVRLLRREW